MLASITPLGERGRHSHYAVTAGAFLLGSLVAGIGAGALLGAAGGLIGWPAADDLRLAALAAALVLAIALDLRPGPAPGPRRQVDERWLERYRGWVYGVGYGAQLGIGIGTVVTSAATYVALLAAWLTAVPAEGATVLGTYGLIRGLTPLLSVRVNSPRRLMALHIGLRRARGPAAAVGLAGLGVALVLSLAGSPA